jgi:hypothetical protein
MSEWVSHNKESRAEPKRRVAPPAMDVPPIRSQRDWIPAMCSIVVHLMVLVSFAIWTARTGLDGQSLTILSGQSDGQELALFEVPTLQQSDSAQETEESIPAPPNFNVIPGMIVAESPSETADVGPNPNPLETPPDLKLPAGGGNLGFVETSMAGRTKENRARLALEHGGSPKSEEAVERALDYLARHQANNGSWSFSFSESCNGECETVRDRTASHITAATGLALLCFLGAGKTEEDDVYGSHVSQAIYYLQNTLKRDSTQGHWVGTESSAQMYEHGIATLALCEACHMKPSEELKESCQLAINYIVNAQFRDGGWDYHPGSPGDLSIAAWQVMALKSALSAKLAVPARTILGVDRFLDKSRSKSRSGEFMYRYRDRKPTTSMTAIGNLLQLFRGRSPEYQRIELAVKHVGAKGPSESDMYFDYYATQLLFHRGGPIWEAWNTKMREYLVRTQELQGHSAGSWWFEDDYSNDIGGRLYVTCMACLTLEVYYRYLPIYEQPAGSDFQF